MVPLAPGPVDQEGSAAVRQLGGSARPLDDPGAGLRRVAVGSRAHLRCIISDAEFVPRSLAGGANQPLPVGEAGQSWMGQQHRDLRDWSHRSCDW